MSETRVGPYRIIRLIKSGGQGRVYLGYDDRLRRQVAIKIHSLPPGRGDRRLALAEARKASRINCPQVVQIFDLIESEDHLAIVMEYVPGCDLEQLLQLRHLSLASTLSVGLDIAVALAAARQQKVVHGDLKPANVLITRTGRAKLTDFGIARETGSDDFPHSGSESALSPEHLRGEPLDVRSDLFALGCLLYRMLTGERPFVGEGRLDPRLLLAEQRPSPGTCTPLHEPLPEGLSSLVVEMLQVNPDDRPANTHPVRRRLRQLRQQLPLVEAGRLRQEAGPAFRPESPEDLPMDIPAGLAAGGRSRIRRGLGGRVLRQLRGFRPSTWVVLVATTASALGIPLVLAMQEHPTRMHFESPSLQLVYSDGLPPEVDERWLMETVYGAAESVLGPLQASGAVRPRAYYASLADAPAEVVLATSLHCDRVLCVFAVSTGSGGSFEYRQALFAPQLPESVLRGLIAEKTRELLD